MRHNPTQHYFTDHLGNKLSVRDICNFFNKSYTTIYEQHRTYKVRTLKDIVHYCKSGRKRNEKRYDTIRGHMTCREIADQAGVATATTYGRGKKYGWDSEVVFWPNMSRDEFNERLKDVGLYVKPPSNNVGRKPRTVSFIDDDGNKLSPSEACKLVNRKSQSMYHYYHKDGCRTIADVLARQQFTVDKQNGIKSKWTPPSSTEYVKPIHRNTICFRRDCHGIINQRCEHYSSCTDSIVFNGVPHKRVKPDDGSCFVGERLLAEHAESLGGQSTDKVGAISR